jgi:hypothetical protein
MVSFHGSVARVAGLSLALALAGCSGSNGDGGITGSGSPTGGAFGGTATSTGTGTGAGAAGEQLFAAPSGDATASSIFGLWGGVLKSGELTFDTRMKLEAHSVTFGTRCRLPNGKTSAVASVVAAARVSTEEIAVLETKLDERKTGDITCRASSQVSSLTACAVVDGFQHDCFALDGLALVFYGTTPFDKIEMTKISD